MPDAAAVLVDQRQHEDGSPTGHAVEVREREPGNGDDDHRRERQEHKSDPVPEEQSEVLAEGSDEAGEHQSRGVVTECAAGEREEGVVQVRSSERELEQLAALPYGRRKHRRDDGRVANNDGGELCGGDERRSALHLAEPAVGERMGGSQPDLWLEAGFGNERRRCTHSKQVAVVEEHEAVAEALGFVHLMGAVEHGGAGAREAEDCREHALARLRIDPHRRLVQKHDLRAVQDAGREAQPPAHADRELRHGLVGAVGEADQVERMADCRGRISRRDALRAGEEVQVLGRRQGGIERDLLGHEPEHAAHGRRLGGQTVPPDRHGAGVEAEQGGEDAERSRLARAVRTKQSDDLARCNGERELRQRNPLAVAFGEPINRDCGRHRYWSHWASFAPAIFVLRELPSIRWPSNANSLERILQGGTRSLAGWKPRSAL